jgi:glycosyltransferase involved in cell wall biosynthesis
VGVGFMPAKKKEVLVSVIVPTLNEEKFIEGCLRSLQRQTVPREKYEVIVSDSSSTDNTVKVARKYSNQVVVCKRQSAGYGRNFGAKFAHGKYLAFADADTIVDEKWIEGVIDGLVQGVACTGPVSALESDSLKLSGAFVFWQFLTRFTVAIGHGLLPGHNLAVRKKEFNELKGFIEGNVTNEDNEFSRRVRTRGQVIYSEKMALRTSTRRLKRINMIAYFLNGVKFFLFGKSMTWNDFREDY